jgi:hypothetical protein
MPKRTEEQIMQEIASCHSRLSPENLSCDGELTPAQTRARGRQIRNSLRSLFRELGREVSEEEAFRWEQERREQRGFPRT